MAKDTTYKSMSDAEIENLIENARRELNELSFNNAVSPLQHSNQIREVRRTIARYLTELNARSLAEAKKAGLILRDRIIERRRRG